MARTLCVLAAATLLVAAGCCHCAAPYDYCQPTFLANPGEPCQPDARMNSAFYPMEVAFYDGVPVAETPAAEEVPPGTPMPEKGLETPPPYNNGSPSDRPRMRSTRQPPRMHLDNVPFDAPHAGQQTSATKAIPVSQEASRKPIQLRR